MANELRTVICADAKVWLEKYSDPLSAVITSLPDADETGMEIAAWEKWFVLMCHLIMVKLADTGYAIFYQTDRKHGGGVIDKSFLCAKAAKEAGLKTVWHKIVLRREPGKTDLYRPGYTHLLCFSKHGRPQKPTPDVLYAGKMIYPNAMGLNACRFSVEFIGKEAGAIYELFMTLFAGRAVFWRLLIN